MSRRARRRSRSTTAPSAIALALERDDDCGARSRSAPSAACPTRPRRALVDAALRFAELDEVVLVADTDRRGGPTLLVQRCAGAPARCTAVVEIGYGDAAGSRRPRARRGRPSRAAELRYPPSVLGDPRVTGRRVVAHHCEVCRSPWLWGGVGAAAVIGTIA